MQKVCANCHHFVQGHCKMVVEHTKRRQAAATFVVLEEDWRLCSERPEDGTCWLWERRRKRTLEEHKQDEADRRAVK